MRFHNAFAVASANIVEDGRVLHGVGSGEVCQVISDPHVRLEKGRSSRSRLLSMRRPIGLLIESNLLLEDLPF
jgi:hypothetical protein